MKLILSKPAMAAFSDDIKASLAVLDRVKSDLGSTNDEVKVNENLTLGFGLQLILRQKDLGSLAQIEGSLAKIPEIPFSIHAPYNYEDNWESADLSRGHEGYINLLEVVKFGDNITAESIAVHPNALRSRDYLTSAGYSREERLIALDRTIQHILEAQATARTTSVNLENKPLPATTPDNERPIYTIAFAPLQDILEFTGRGGEVTFDTCHFGITRHTINTLLADVEGKLTDQELRHRQMEGYFARDYVVQPTIEQTLAMLTDSVRHIHLNDGSIYRPNPKTGFPDLTKPLPKAGGFTLWWEAYVPGRGELCNYSVIFKWLKQQQEKNETVVLTMEVGEFDRNYKESPNAYKALRKMGEEIISHF